jgi:hypothetical protein
VRNRSRRDAGLGRDIPDTYVKFQEASVNNIRPVDLSLTI